MSEQVQNAEIEDVLTSIRKLVSNGQDEEQVVTETISAPQEAPNTPDDAQDAEIFLLSHAARVSDPYANAGFEGEDQATDVENTPPDLADAAPLQLEEAPAAHTEAQPLDAADDMDNLEGGALKDQLARVQTILDARANDFEQDGGTGTANAAQSETVIPWSDLQSTTPKPEMTEPQSPQPQEVRVQEEAASEPAAPTAQPSVQGGDADEETLLNDEDLRTLISAIVREELQGTTGERITRSVRKLVRNEINRAMATRELE